MIFNYRPVQTDKNRKSISEKVNGFRLYGLEQQNGDFRIEVHHKQYDRPIFRGKFKTQKSFENAFESEYNILSVAEHDKYFKKFKPQEVNELSEFTSKDEKIIVKVHSIQSEKGIYVSIIDDGVTADLGRNFPDIDTARNVARNTIRAYDLWGNYVRMSLTRKGRIKLPHEIYEEEMPKQFQKTADDLKKELEEFCNYFIGELGRL